MTGTGSKVMTTGQKREATVIIYEATGLSQRRACRLAGLPLSTYRYEAQRPATDAHLSGRIITYSGRGLTLRIMAQIGPWSTGGLRSP